MTRPDQIGERSEPRRSVGVLIAGVWCRELERFAAPSRTARWGPAAASGRSSPSYLASAKVTPVLSIRRACNETFLARAAPRRLGQAAHQVRRRERRGGPPVPRRDE